MTFPGEEMLIVSENRKEFDVAMNTLLIALGAEQYAPLFKDWDIGQCALTQFSEDDLILMGVDDETIRKRLLRAAKALPIYKETSLQSSLVSLGPIDVVEMLEESSQHLYRIYLSIMANTLAMKKTKNITDDLLLKDKYASEIALSTLKEINNVINSVELTLHTQLKTLRKNNIITKKKKLVVGTIGSAVIAFLGVLFTRSLKQLKE